jgi:hypothetical protein
MMDRLAHSAMSMALKNLRSALCSANQNQPKVCLISSTNWGKGTGVNERKKARKIIPPITFLFQSSDV